jgi:K+-transporting ATPase ATPase C chain
MNTSSHATGEFPALPTPNSALDHSGGGLGTATRFAFVAIIAFGLLLPAAGVLLGQLLFPAQARGSLIERDGKVLGSALIAQPFADDKYFRPRPSAAGFDPRAMSGSNWAPSNPALRERIAASSAEVAAREQVAVSAIPSDLVTASGSGVDPHISPTAADLQIERVATARHMAPERVRALVVENTEQPTVSVFGQARVNVLQLNLALDEATP